MKPIKSFKAGAVKASIFENVTQMNGAPVTTHRVVMDKSFKDRSGQWQSTSSLAGVQDLPKAILVLQKCYEFLLLQETSPDSREENAA